MNAPTVQCPQCFHRLPAPAEPTDKLVCPSCESVFAPKVEEPSRKNPSVPVARAIPRASSTPVAAATPSADPVPAARPAKPVEPARATPVKRADDRSHRRDDEDAPQRSRRRNDDEDDDRPRSRRRRYEDDDDKPAKKKGGSALPIILIVGGLLAVLTLGGIAAVVATVFWSTPVANATKPGYFQPLPPQPIEPDWVGPNGPNGANGPGGLAGGPGDFPQPGGGPGGLGGGAPQPGGLGGGIPGGPPVEPWNPQPDKPKVPKVAPKFAEIVPQEIKPAKLTEDTFEVKLPGKIGDTCAGGGGRFFILHLSDKRQLAIFDVNEAKVVKYLALASDTVKFAAGMNKLIVAYPDQSTFTRYDLTTFEKETTAKSPLGGTVGHLCMGSASSGPLLVGTTGGGRFGGGGITFLDPTSFKEVDIEFAGGGRPGWGEQMHYRAGPDGTMFGAWSSGSSPMGLNTIVVKGGTAKQFNQHTSVGHIQPGPDGTVYTGNGLYSSELKKLDRTRNFFLPAAEGHLYLRLNNGDPMPPQFPGLWPGDGHKLTAEVRMPGDERAVYTYKNLGPFASDAWTRHDFTCDKRVHFSPTAGVLVTVPGTNDKLVLHKFDLEGSFEASGVDYLYVASRPPTAVPGKGYEYQIAVKSKKGGVKCKLDAGPTGLKVTDAGKVTWATPADFTTPEQVIITVSDASGQEIFHTFELAPGDGKGFAGPITGGAKVTPREGAKPDPLAGQGLVAVPDRMFEIKPPPLQERTTVALPGAADAVCAGGGGRFLIYRLSGKKQLAVLDVTVGRVVKYVPLAEADALFAAGMTKLFVFNKTAGVFLRYDLEKFEKDLTAQNPLGGSPSLILMGHASEGPLYVGGADVGTDTKGYGFINTRTMKEQSVPLEGGGNGQPGNGQPVGGPAFGGDRFGGARATAVAVSPDGRTYTWSDDWGGNKVMILGEKTAKVKGDGIGGGQNRGALIPGPDGHLFGGQGVFTSELKKLGDNKQSVNGTFAPATSGPWYVSIIEGDRWAPGGPSKRKVHIALTSDDRFKFPVDSLNGLPVANQEPWAPQAGTKVPMAARLHLVPEAEILAVLDDGMEKVHLHRVPVKALLAKADADHMLVVSRPRPAVRGQKWTYTPEVWSKKGGVKVKLESGPDGMSAAGGTVTWDVPTKFADGEPTVILTVSDASGQETFHTFPLSVRSEPLPVLSVIKPAPPVVDPAQALDPKKGPAKPTAALLIKPTAAKDGTDVELSGAADYACVAGGGRFLLLRIPSKKEVAVFDVVEGKVVKQLPLPEDGSLVAGGRSFAYVISPKVGLVQRWNLSTLEKEATTKLPEGFAPQVAVMGHASEGPMYLGGGGRTHPAVKTTNGFYDPLTLAKLEYKSADPDKQLSLPEESYSDTVHASPDGRVFTWWRRDSIPNGVSTFTLLDGGIARFLYAHSSAAALMVGAGGIVFTACGVFSADFKTIYDSHPDGVKQHRAFEIETGGYPGQYGRTAVPATDGPWYLWFAPTKKDGTDPGGPPTLKMLGVTESLGELKGVRGLEDPKENRPNAPARGNYLQPNPSVFPYYQRTFLIPAAELLAVLSADGARIYIHSFKARELIDKSGQDYLLVMGRPPQFAPPGTKWAYTPDVWSKKGGVKIEVVTGPPGLKAEGTGVSWDVPKDLLDNQVLVELKVSDTSGKSVPHAFNLSLTDTAPTPVAAPPSGDPSPQPGGVPSLPARPRPRPSVPTPEVPKKEEPSGHGKKLEKGKIDDALIGTWVVTKTESGGQTFPSAGDVKHTFNKDGTLRKTVVRQETEWTYTVDVAASPKMMDMVKAGPEDRGYTTHAVYEVMGDTLRLCYASGGLGGDRPTALKDDGKVIILTFERLKEGADKEKPKGPAPVAPKPVAPVKDDPKKGKIGEKGRVDEALVGTWTVEKVEWGGGGGAVDTKRDPSLLKTRFVFQKDGISKAGGIPDLSYLIPGTFTTDPAAKPKAIDLVGTRNKQEATQMAVYEVDGDTLKICLGQVADMPRPKEIKAEERGIMLVSLKRVKDEPSGSVPPVKPPVPKDPVAPKPADALKAADPGKKDDKDEALVGTWATDKIEVGGRAMPLPPPVAGIRHIFDKDGGVRVTGGPGGDELTGTYKLDTSVSPKAIDMTLKSKSGVEQKHSGVYEVTGDTLVLSMPPVPGGARPTDLKGTQAPVMTHKRVKDEAKKEEPKK